MKFHFVVLCLCVASLLISYSGDAAEPTEAERKRFVETKAKAE